MARSQRVIDGNWEVRPGAQFGLAVVGGVSLTVPSDAQAVLLQAQVADVRWSDDSASPPANGSGMLLSAGDPPFLYTGELDQLVFEEESATSGAEVNASYYGWVD